MTIAAALRLEELLDRLFGLYLAVGHGNWQDHLDVTGRALPKPPRHRASITCFLASPKCCGSRRVLSLA